MNGYDKERIWKECLCNRASSGIGKACALSFANAGCHVIGAALDCEESVRHYDNGGFFELHNMDVTSDTEVTKRISGIETIDIAVLCAGIGVAGPVEELPMALAEKQMAVNYFGTLRVCQAILPKMRKQQRGLLLVISSIAGKVPIPMQSHYSSSKYALEAMVEAIRLEMRPFNIQAVLIEPGDTHTSFTENRQFYDTSNSIYKEICANSVGKMEQDERNGRPPQSVADVALKMAGKKKPPIRVAVGFEYKLLMFVMRFLPDKVRAEILYRLYLS